MGGDPDANNPGSLTVLSLPHPASAAGGATPPSRAGKPNQKAPRRGQPWIEVKGGEDEPEDTSDGPPWGGVVRAQRVGSTPARICSRTERKEDEVTAPWIFPTMIPSAFTKYVSGMPNTPYSTAPRRFGSSTYR